MRTGKIPNDILEKLILRKVMKNRSEVILRPKTGEDCSAIDFGDFACVLSTDPITGTSKEIGRLAVHVSCNDIASCGVEPLGLLVTLLCPPGAEEKDIEIIMEQLISTASSINVDILGGHTEVTASVTRFVISSTAVGRCLKKDFINTSDAKAGDSLVLTKHAGLEGASIIAFEKEDELIDALGSGTVNEAKSFINDLSVVKEGLLSAQFGVSAMHDVTEGGILGAVWEMCEASGKGAKLYIDKIPIAMSTKKICEYYSINPFKLMSSGCMLISAPDGEGLVSHLRKAGLKAEIIGSLNDTKERLMVSQGDCNNIPAPEADELYRIL